MAMLASYAVFFAAIALATGGSGHACFAIAISILYALIFVGVARTIGPFMATTLPKGLLAEHRLKPDRWGWFSLHEGAVRLVMDDGYGTVTHLAAPATALILPEGPHHVEFDGDFLQEIAFLAGEAV